MTKKNFLIILIISIFIIFIAADAAGGIFLWQRLIRNNHGQRTQINALSAQLNQQQANITTLQNKLSQYIRSQQQNSSQQALNEIAYLLDLANLYLQINHYAANASKSLQLAQHHLQMLADPSLLPLQQALASDLNRLNDAAQLDTTDVLLKLQTLAESISRLNLLAPAAPVTPPVSLATPANSPKPWYQQSLHAFWDSFKSLFIIRYHSGVIPILPPEQREWIHENIAFTLAQAQWAVLQQKSSLYQLSLTQVQQWVTLYFPDTPERAKILERLAGLAAINIAPPLPDINASLRAVQKALQELPIPAAPSTAATPPKLETSPPPATPTPVPPPAEPTTPAGVEI